MKLCDPILRMSLTCARCTVFGRGMRGTEKDTIMTIKIMINNNRRNNINDNNTSVRVRVKRCPKAYIHTRGTDRLCEVA